jgi:hypothetical protein
MQLIQKQYDHFTNKSKNEIIKTLLHRIDAQKGAKSSFKWDIVNYQCFRVVGDRIKVQRSLSILTPFKSTGAIYYDLISTNNGTKSDVRLCRLISML